LSANILSIALRVPEPRSRERKVSLASWLNLTRFSLVRGWSGAAITTSGYQEFLGADTQSIGWLPHDGEVSVVVRQVL